MNKWGFRKKDEIDCLLESLYHPPTFKDKVWRIIVKNVPHKTYSNYWFMPIWWVFIFGGTYDTGNGSCTRPNLYYTIRNYIKSRKIQKAENKYWDEYYKKYGCSTEDGITKVSYDGGETYTDATPL